MEHDRKTLSATLQAGTIQMTIGALDNFHICGYHINTDKDIAGI